MANNCNKCGTNCKCTTNAYNAYNSTNSCNGYSSCGGDASDISIGTAYDWLNIKCGDNMENVIRYINEYLLKVEEELSLENIIVECDESPCGNGECCVDLTGLELTCSSDTLPDLELLPVLQYFEQRIAANRYTFKSEDFVETVSGCNKEVSLRSDGFAEENMELTGIYSGDATQVINVYSSTTYEDTSAKRAVKRGETVTINSGFGFEHVGGVGMDFTMDATQGYSTEYIVLGNFPSTDMQPSDVQKFYAKGQIMSTGYIAIDSEIDCMIEFAPVLGYVEVRFYTMETGITTIAADKGVRIFSNSGFVYNV